MFPIILKSKDQRSSTPEIKVEIWFPGFRPLFLTPRVTISIIWTTHGRKIFPIEFEVRGQRSCALDIEVEIWFPGSIVTLYHTYGLPI
jgi:hypothetical protein